VFGDTKFEPTETFLVNLTNAVNATFTDSVGVGSIKNDDGLPSLSIDDMKVLEGDSGKTLAIFTVTLSNTSANPLSVDYQTSDGTATLANDDYQKASGTLTIPHKTSSGQITVSVDGDTKYEPDETYFVNLSNAVGATIADGQGQGTISNDDGVPTITITDVK